MASRNRIALNQTFFSRLIEHASLNGVEIQNPTEGRWIARLSDDDAQLMTKADVIGLQKLTKSLRVVALSFESKKYIVFFGLSEVKDLPEGLSEVDITPALFLVPVVEAGVLPSATGFAVKEAVEGLYQGVVDYSGHDLNEILALYPNCQAFVADTNYDFTGSLPRVIGTMIARSYENGPIELSRETLAIASDLFEEGSPHLPYEVILQGLMSISWRGFYLGLYRCIEQLFPVSALANLIRETGDDRPIIDIAEILERQLAWRPKEDVALEGLMKGVSGELVGHFITCLQIQVPEHTSYEKSVAKRIYSLRNGMVHFRPGVSSVDELGEQREDTMVRLMVELVAELYSQHGAAFHGDL